LTSASPVVSVAEVSGSEAIVFYGHVVRPEDLRGNVPIAVVVQSLSGTAAALLVVAVISLLSALMTLRQGNDQRLRWLTSLRCLGAFVITAVTIQRQVGGSLASLFDMVADTVRQRQQFARRIRSLTAMGRMSAYVLVGLPFFLALVMTLINRKFMAPLFDKHSGHLMLLGGLSMMAVGSLMLKKIVSFRG
jgi:hypothetical protein